MEWKTVKLGEVCNIRRGASPRPIQEFLSSQGMPWIKISDATATDSKYIDKTKEFIIEEGVSHSVLIEPGSLIVSNSATPGLPKISRITACVHDGWLVIDNFRGILKDFLYYKFIEIRSILGNQANGSVFMNLKTDIVKEFLIHIPDIEKQRKIVSILSSLDDKIENNNRINRNLEAQAQALFKSWFVDFEPWGGTMPEDWKEYELGEFLPVITGKKDANIASKTGKYPFFSCAQDILYTENYSFNADAILVAGNGDFNVKWYRGKFEAYQRTYVLIPNDSRYLGWLFYMVKHNLSNITCGARGSVIKFITKGNLENFRFAAPKDLTKCDIIDKFNVINQTIESKKAESHRLATLRDTLLPKLMKGDIAL